MSVKEKIVEHLDAMNEAELTTLERQLRKSKSEKLEEEFRLLDILAEPMSEEDQAVFEENVRRRPLFGNRKLEMEPDDA